ncbi:MAG: 16S rRNA (cytidine(1402)-2'-O)-methyltransferase [Dehalococcoidia bacterium]|nr:16S rRNA (cytidine(1402)-2'-O)-methyltransferase [Dehalococcoidia bacterium]
MSTLYIVATPIGNLEDITLRALRILKEVGLVAAEDTRHAQRLFARYDLHTRLIAYHEQGQRSRAAPVLAHLEHADAALITDAGMPAVSDPGYALIAAAIAAGHRIEVVPGASAVTAALVSSGLPSDQFVFAGFLPRTAGARRRLLESLRDQHRTLVAFEAPHRLRAALADIAAVLGDRPIAVARELTKLHEEIFRGSAQQALAHFTRPRGEITLVIAGGTGAAPAPTPASDLLARARALRQQSLTARDAVAALMHSAGIGRKEAYRLWLESAASPDAVGT